MSKSVNSKKERNLEKECEMLPGKSILEECYQYHRNKSIERSYKISFPIWGSHSKPDYSDYIFGILNGRKNNKSKL